MSYKHFAFGPWAQLNGSMTWHKLRLLMDYPEQYALYFPAGTPPQDMDVDQYLLTSLLGDIPPWWNILWFDDRRTKDYKQAASETWDKGQFPVLHHEFAAISELMSMVLRRHPELKGMKLKLYTKQVGEQQFGGLYLVDDLQRVIVPKLESFSGIYSRSQASDWPMQADVARWLTDASQALMLVVDQSPPGRSVLLPMFTREPEATRLLISPYLNSTYQSVTTMSYAAMIKSGQLEWPRRWVSQQVPRSAEFKAAAATVMTVGKYSGKTLDEVASTDEGLHYLEWLRDQAGEADERPVVQALRVYLADPLIRKAAGHKV